ncbi:MAG: DMT family transporter [Hespellia sp.]|nr:DMT family transporter [Hespellia sp.]
MNKLKINSMLFLSAFIWGLAFVAQQIGMEYMEPFTFNSIRFFIGSIVLLPCIWLLDRKKNASQVSSHSVDKKTLYVGAICCGIPLAFASGVQQVALLYSPAGKVGFLTALYILFVPIFGIFLKKKAGLHIWLGVLVAVIGMYLLCITDSFSLGKGDAYALLCAVIFALQIMFVDHFSPKTDGLRLSCLEFLVAGIINAIFMFFTETPDISYILAAALPLLYAGVLSCGVAYTLQVIAQKDADPSIAALIMSLESVFSVLGGWVILHQILSPREIFGCLLMFSATILAQLPGKRNL